MSTYIDVFNGDADGIFSLIQWRKAYPITGVDTQHLITGVKRDISLVRNIDKSLAKDAYVTVLDVSFDKNTDAVRQILPLCSSLFYCDHHKADTLFDDPKLTVCIDTSAIVCTGLLTNKTLNNTYPLWAIAAAFGDGLDSIAERYVKQAGLTNIQRDQLKELGILVNYNGYGSTVEDLYFKPDELYKLLLSYDSPFDIIADAKSPFITLQQGFEADMAHANTATPLEYEGVVGFILADESWARRISGTFGNQLAANNPDSPVVIVTTNSQGSYTISLRAPKNNLHGASSICSQFATGGGREGAAGVNELPVPQLYEFLATVKQFYATS